MLVYILAVSLLYAADAVHGEELSRRYRFQRSLDGDGGLYVLHWSFDLEAGTIAFAVNVSTTGWVGFGLSPNGQMPLSDVVIGWVDSEGEAQFHDRFAERRAEPTIDASQDWILTASSEQDGRTVLEFNRALVTCDEQYDIDITSDTARIVWSYGANDPAGITGLAQHIRSASISINLLGGLNEETRDTEGAEFFELRNDNVTIPNTDTTYWCEVIRLPDIIRNAEQEVYIFRQSPAITPHAQQFVHHMLAFICPFIQSTNYSGSCDFGVPFDVRLCRNVQVVGSWAVGGEDFIYPNGVAFPIGGQASSLEYVLLETHYDNPGLISGVTDSSGFRFYYTTTPPTHKAGTMILGHNNNRLMVVPPGSSSGYTISGVCKPSCTSAQFPENGITVFASYLHTHLLGRALRVRHYTTSDPDCDGFKELEPIDQNLQYDFDFQQNNIIPQRIVKPGDALELECFYNSSRRGITLGGESTQEEMCFNFLTYYPKIDLSICASQPTPSSFQAFTDQYFSANQSQEILADLADRNMEGIEENFNSVDWTPTALSDLESSLRAGNLSTFCITNFLSPTSIRQQEPNPVVRCPYVPPPKECTPAPTSTSSGQIMVPSALLLAVPLLASRM